MGSVAFLLLPTVSHHRPRQARHRCARRQFRAIGKLQRYAKRAKETAFRCDRCFYMRRSSPSSYHALPVALARIDHPSGWQTRYYHIWECVRHLRRCIFACSSYLPLFAIASASTRVTVSSLEKKIYKLVQNICVRNKILKPS